MPLFNNRKKAQASITRAKSMPEPTATAEATPIADPKTGGDAGADAGAGPGAGVGAGANRRMSHQLVETITKQQIVKSTHALQDEHGNGRSLIAGRQPTADIVLLYAECSRQHAKISSQPDDKGEWTFSVTDLGASNGTFLNGTRLVANTPTPLRLNDCLNFGVESVEKVHAYTVLESALDIKHVGVPASMPVGGSMIDLRSPSSCQTASSAPLADGEIAVGTSANDSEVQQAATSSTPTPITSPSGGGGDGGQEGGGGQPQPEDSVVSGPDPNMLQFQQIARPDRAVTSEETSQLRSGVVTQPSITTTSFSPVSPPPAGRDAPKASSEQSPQQIAPLAAATAGVATSPSRQQQANAHAGPQRRLQRQQTDIFPKEAEPLPQDLAENSTHRPARDHPHADRLLMAHLGIQPEEQEKMQWVIDAAMREPVPEGYRAHRNEARTWFSADDGSQVSWDHPFDPQYRALVAEMRQQEAVQLALKQVVQKMSLLVAQSQANVEKHRGNIPSLMDVPIRSMPPPIVRGGGSAAANPGDGSGSGSAVVKPSPSRSPQRGVAAASSRRNNGEQTLGAVAETDGTKKGGHAGGSEKREWRVAGSVALEAQREHRKSTGQFKSANSTDPASQSQIRELRKQLAASKKRAADAEAAADAAKAEANEERQRSNMNNPRRYQSQGNFPDAPAAGDGMPIAVESNTGGAAMAIASAERRAADAEAKVYSMQVELGVAIEKANLMAAARVRALEAESVVHTLNRRLIDLGAKLAASDEQVLNLDAEVRELNNTVETLRGESKSHDTDVQMMLHNDPASAVLKARELRLNAREAAIFARESKCELAERNLKLANLRSNVDHAESNGAASKEAIALLVEMGITVGNDGKPDLASIYRGGLGGGGGGGGGQAAQYSYTRAAKQATDEHRRRWAPHGEGQNEWSANNALAPREPFTQGVQGNLKTQPHKSPGANRHNNHVLTHGSGSKQHAKGQQPRAGNVNSGVSNPFEMVPIGDVSGDNEGHTDHGHDSKHRSKGDGKRHRGRDRERSKQPPQTRQEAMALPPDAVRKLDRILAGRSPSPPPQEVIDAGAAAMVEEAKALVTKAHESTATTATTGNVENPDGGVGGGGGGGGGGGESADFRYSGYDDVESSAYNAFPNTTRSPLVVPIAASPQGSLASVLEAARQGKPLPAHALTMSPEQLFAVSPDGRNANSSAKGRHNDAVNNATNGRPKRSVNGGVDGDKRLPFIVSAPPPWQEEKPRKHLSGPAAYVAAAAAATATKGSK